MIVHLVDGTYELFRHFYGLRRFSKGSDPPSGAVIGVLNTLLQLIEEGATHLGVAWQTKAKPHDCKKNRAMLAQSDARRSRKLGSERTLPL